MARFDVCKTEARALSLVLIVQSDFLEALPTTVVIPLRAASSWRGECYDKLNPILTVDGADYVATTNDIVSLPNRLVGAVVANVEDEHRDDITRALDTLLIGL